MHGTLKYMRHIIGPVRQSTSYKNLRMGYELATNTPKRKIVCLEIVLKRTTQII